MPILHQNELTLLLNKLHEPNSYAKLVLMVLANGENPFIETQKESSFNTFGTAFAAPVSSRLTITPSSLDLTISAGNLNGKTVYVQTWRPAVNGYPARYFKPRQLTATGNTVTFNDLDEPGSTIASVTYFTVALLEPIPQGEARYFNQRMLTA